jgi:hypothetical protein
MLLYPAENRQFLLGSYRDAEERGIFVAGPILSKYNS